MTLWFSENELKKHIKNRATVIMRAKTSKAAFLHRIICSSKRARDVAGDVMIGFGFVRSLNTKMARFAC